VVLTKGQDVGGEIQPVLVFEARCPDRRGHVAVRELCVRDRRQVETTVFEMTNGEKGPRVEIEKIISIDAQVLHPLDAEDPVIPNSG
jgi:hypothetical protein